VQRLRVDVDGALRLAVHRAETGELYFTADYGDS
jgi:hypothetical protein